MPGQLLTNSSTKSPVISPHQLYWFYLLCYYSNRKAAYHQTACFCIHQATNAIVAIDVNQYDTVCVKTKSAKAPGVCIFSSSSSLFICLNWSPTHLFQLSEMNFYCFTFTQWSQRNTITGILLYRSLLSVITNVNCGDIALCFYCDYRWYITDRSTKWLSTKWMLPKHESLE